MNTLAGWFWVGLIGVTVGAYIVSLHLHKRARKAQMHIEKQSSQLALELHPAYQQKIQADRAYELQWRKQRADEEQFDREFALKQYLALHYVPPETYVVNADLGRVTALPSLKAPSVNAIGAGQGSGSGELALPPAFDMADIVRGRMPSEQGVFVARGATSGDIWVPPYKMCHVLGGGNTGGGKTIIARNFAMQLVAVPDIQTYMYDPHAAPVKRQPDGRLLDNRPLYPRLSGGKPITDAKEMYEFLDSMIRKEMEERKKRERAYQNIGQAIFILVEEMPILADESPQAIALLAKLLKRSRQYLIFCICISQNLLVKTTGLDTGDRSQYRTGLYTGGDDITAKVVLDIQSIKEIDETPLGKPGIVYSRTDVSPVQLSRVGYASNAACYELLGNSSSIALPDRPVSEAEWNRLGELLRTENIHSSTRQTGPLACSSVSYDEHMNAMNAPLERDEYGETFMQRMNVQTPKMNVSPEERAIILAGARVQLKATGREKVNRTQLRDALGWNNAKWDIIKQVLDEEGL